MVTACCPTDGRSRDPDAARESSACPLDGAGRGSLPGHARGTRRIPQSPGLPDPVAGTDATDAAWIPAEAVLSGEAALAFDHRRIAADAIERARTKIEFSALATAFCRESFTIAELQQVYEAVWGTPLDTRNFYRKVQAAKGFIVPAGTDRKTTGGRPARLYRAGPNTVLFPPLIRPAPSATEENTRGEEE